MFFFPWLLPGILLAADKSSLAYLEHHFSFASSLGTPLFFLHLQSPFLVVASYLPHSSRELPVSVALFGTWPGGQATYPIQILILEDAHLQALLGHLHGPHTIHKRAVEQLHQLNAEVVVGLLGRRGQLAEAGVHVAGGHAAAALLERLQELVEPATPAGSPLHGPQQLLRPFHLASLQRDRPHLLPVLRAERREPVQHRLHPNELLQPRPEARDHVEEPLI